jgi:hypothetical protein
VLRYQAWVDVAVHAGRNRVFRDGGGNGRCIDWAAAAVFPADPRTRREPPGLSRSGFPTTATASSHPGAGATAGAFGDQTGSTTNRRRRCVPLGIALEGDGRAPVAAVCVVGATTVLAGRAGAPGGSQTIAGRSESGLRHPALGSARNPCPRACLDAFLTGRFLPPSGRRASRALPRCSENSTDPWFCACRQRPVRLESNICRAPRPPR